MRILGGGAPLKASHSKGLRRIDTIEVVTTSRATQDVVTRRKQAEQSAQWSAQRDVVTPNKSDNDNICNGLLRRFVAKVSHLGEISPHNDMSYGHYEEKQSEQSVKWFVRSDVVIPDKKSNRHAEGAQATEASHNLEKRSFANAQDDVLSNISANKTKISHNSTKKKVAFTLTEVLLAVLIVGIIATIVLPAIITKYQDKVLDSAYKREVHSIQDSIDALAAVENKDSFYETTLATNAEAYMKKYLRVSKYCENGKDCFGKYYSKYTDNEKKTYTPSYDGSCAILKNGTSLCLNVSGGNVDMLIDVNGPKGPNVFGRDLRTYSYSAKGKTGYNMSSSGIIAINQDPIKDNGTDDPCEGKTCGCGDLPACDPCETDVNSYACCKKRTLSGSGDKCCQYEDFKYTQICHPCPINGATYVPKIACVYILHSFNPIKAAKGSPELLKWDPDFEEWINENSKNDYFDFSYQNDDYWAGAKKACAFYGWNLPDEKTLVNIASINKSENLGLPTEYYWSSTQQNGLVGIFVDFSAVHSYGYVKYNTSPKAMCLVE